jgi:hypothetical protein
MLAWHSSCLSTGCVFAIIGLARDNSRVSLKSRIRDAAKRKPDSLHSTETERGGPNLDSEEEINESAPTVEKIRTTLLRKTANGKDSE